MVRKKAFILDIQPFVKQNTSFIKLIVKGKVRSTLFYQFDPYFLVDPGDADPDVLAKELKKIPFSHNSKTITIKSTSTVVKKLKHELKRFVKVVCHTPTDIAPIVKSLPFECYEYRIPYILRFCIDYGVSASTTITYEREGRFIKKILGKTTTIPSLSVAAFDIEVSNPVGVPRPKEDPVVAISYVFHPSWVPNAQGKSKDIVFTWKPSSHPYVLSANDEATMFEQFSSTLKQDNPDFLIGYNSASFDVPYMRDRARALKLDFLWAKNGFVKRVRRGMYFLTRLKDRIHLDIFPLMRFFGILGMFDIRTYSLKNIYHEVSGDDKLMVDRMAMWKMWEDDQVDLITKYCLGDARATYYLFNHFSLLMLELSRLSGYPLFDIMAATSGQMVESLLMQACVKHNHIIPPKPSRSVVERRQKYKVEGGHVKLPEPGIYENIAVFDFRSLYPSIIISYNVDPDTITDEPDAYVSPIGVRFSRHRKGILPQTLRYLVEERAKIKHRLKTMNKHDEEYGLLKARSQALKIIANTFYGYLAYVNSRWYSRKCAGSVTAWGRHYIKKAEAYVEKKGFKVLYIDTDSLFVLYGDRDKKEVLALLDEINRTLPENMELELEAFYKRGVFVSKKQGGQGAKKKYALLREDGEIKIRGFELVRRDWSGIARKTQEQVLRTILEKGSKEEAVQIVRDVIDKLKNNKVPKEDLIIYTQLRKKVESYAVKSPEVHAVETAREHGIVLGPGSIVPYIITKKGSSISEKAVYADFAKDYDPDYYIKHQVIPAVMKILKELGYDEEDLLYGGKQDSLTSFFN